MNMFFGITTCLFAATAATTEELKAVKRHIPIQAALKETGGSKKCSELKKEKKCPKDHIYDILKRDDFVDAGLFINKFSDYGKKCCRLDRQFCNEYFGPGSCYHGEKVAGWKNCAQKECTDEDTEECCVLEPGSPLNKLKLQEEACEYGGPSFKEDRCFARKAVLNAVEKFKREKKTCLLEIVGGYSGLRNNCVYKEVEVDGCKPGPEKFFNVCYEGCDVIPRQVVCDSANQCSWDTESEKCLVSTLHKASSSVKSFFGW